MDHVHRNPAASHPPPPSSPPPPYLLPGEHQEGGDDDANIEWLSMLVEDCLSATPTYTTTTTTTFPSAAVAANPQPELPTIEPSMVSKARGKRKRVTPRAQEQAFHDNPPLLLQTHWLADSELIFPKREPPQDVSAIGGGGGGRGMEEMVGKEEGGQGQQQQTRRCTHCHSQKTPQWRAGPQGPKTLCNACGVRFKSGRLLPEYRPAKSPTFVSYKHSNSHKKVMEMRMALLSSSHQHSNSKALGFD